MPADGRDKQATFKVLSRYKSFFDLCPPDYRIKYSGNKMEFKIPYRDIKDKIFDPVIQRILKLMDAQIRNSLKSTDKIEAIILVGGFGSSRYLKTRLKEKYNPMNIEVYSNPSKGVNAISQGAVSYALDPRAISRVFATDINATEASSLLPNFDSNEDYRADFVIGIG
jgi:molecular chaperone DnaK (HSP70)